MPTKAEELLGYAEVSVEFEDAREEELIRIGVMGEDTRDWLNSELGRFVMAAAVEDQRSLEGKMARTWIIGPIGKRKMRKLQMQHEAISLAIGWLTERITMGMEAQRILDLPRE